MVVLAAAFGTGPAHGAGSAKAAPEVARLSPAEADAMSSADLAVKAGAEQGGLERADALDKAFKVPLRTAAKGKPTLIIWSDPLCPNCRDFEQKVIDKIPSTVGLAVVPVSFKDGSRPLVSFVACGVNDVDRAARWTNLMSLSPSDDFSAQCKKGPDVADSNSVLFARTGLTATPTLMRADGRIFDGDRNSVDAIEKWLAN